MTIEGDVDIRRREAAEWFARLNQRTVTTADVKGFSEWRRDPENARAFSRVEAMWDAAGALAKSPEMSALAREAAGLRPPQTAFDDRPPPTDRRRRRLGAGLRRDCFRLAVPAADALRHGGRGTTHLST
jgi:ferric-dicitrate binding protein FerR (iron transport regulator)